MFSVVSVCLFTVGVSHVTITQDGLELTVHGSPPPGPTPRRGSQQYREDPSPRCLHLVATVAHMVGKWVVCILLERFLVEYVLGSEIVSCNHLGGGRET